MLWDSLPNLSGLPLIILCLAEKTKKPKKSQRSRKKSGVLQKLGKESVSRKLWSMLSECREDTDAKEEKAFAGLDN